MIRFLAATALIITCAAAPAHAYVGSNGMNMQGLSRNGVSLNGNWSNGWRTNGVSPNGWRTNGVSPNGRSVSQQNVLDSSALIEVELPR